VADPEMVSTVKLTTARRRARLPRRAVVVCAVVLSLLGARSLARGAPSAARPVPALSGVRTLSAASGFAEAFARAYLTWDALRPENHAVALAPFVGPDVDVDAGLPVPVSGRSRVTWTATVGETATDPGRSVVTVAVAVDGDPRLRYLAVPVSSTGAGLAVADYPALVGRPAPAQAQGRSGDDIDNPGLATVARRALANYLSGEVGNLQADLAPGAQLTPPAEHLALDDVVSLQWADRGRSRVSAVVVARNRTTDVAYTLRYELRVARRDRWYVAEINPPLARKEPA
jgi:hypothetical protein